MVETAHPFIVAGQERASGSTSDVGNPFSGEVVGTVHLAAAALLHPADGAAGPVGSVRRGSVCGRVGWWPLRRSRRHVDTTVARCSWEQRATE
jgi:hypothetical protein